MNELKLAYEEMNIHYDIIENMFTIQDKYTNYRQKATACHKLASYSKISNSLAVSMEKLNLTPLTLDVQSAYTLSREGFWDSVKNFFKAIGKYFKRIFLAIFAQDMVEKEEKVLDKCSDKCNKLANDAHELYDKALKMLDDALKRTEPLNFDKVHKVNVPSASEISKTDEMSKTSDFPDFKAVVDADKLLLKLSKLEEFANSETNNNKVKELAKFKLKMARDSFIDILLHCRYGIDFKSAAHKYNILFKFNTDAINMVLEGLKKTFDLIIKNNGDIAINDVIDELSNAIKGWNHKNAVEPGVAKMVSDEIMASGSSVNNDDIFSYVFDGKKIGVVFKDGDGGNELTLNYLKELELKTKELKDITEDFQLPYLLNSPKETIDSLRVTLKAKQYHIKDLKSKYKRTINKISSCIENIEKDIKKVEVLLEKKNNNTNKPDPSVSLVIKVIRNAMKQLSSVAIPWVSDLRRHTILNIEYHVNYIEQAMNIMGFTPDDNK